MKPTSVLTRVSLFLLAVLTSAVVLGGTVIGMEASGEADHTLLALQNVTNRVTELN